MTFFSKDDKRSLDSLIPSSYSGDSIYGSRISLVIGCLADDLDKCRSLMLGLKDNRKYIKEIVCVVSNLSKKYLHKASELEKLIDTPTNMLFFESIILPGEARNIGVKLSKCSYIAFLDVNTVPEVDWLEIALTHLDKSDNQGILGRTRYIGETIFEKSFIASTYGSNPLYTVPGTLISRSLLNEIGYFIPSARCGEDGEWINRALYFQRSIKVASASPLKYRNLIGRNFPELCKKWFTNYYLASYGDLLIYQKQRYIYIIFFAVLSLGLASCWNPSFAGWDTDAVLYIPHVSKITVFTLLTIYFILRGILLPKNKGVPIIRNGFIPFFLTLLISISLDLVKTFAFIISTIDRNLISKYKTKPRIR
ncbi:glycosyltransferase family A protein [Prochlorococcus sp. MIT 1341]|uniref:glycosyltransferase family A protein n=1 Tax=Prochlorococcus sp. MIT 1341 TaxID=3096221 RepID=UPI002A74C9A5|nr:glycosyltransferase [Prochlorococcus sp. MIT 1341]